MSQAHSCVPNPDGTCSICGDVALEGRIVNLTADRTMADVEMNGSVVQVSVDLLEEPVVGDRVLVHQGFVIARLERVAVERVRDYSRELYPFLYGAQEVQLADVLAEVRVSTLQKCRDVVELRRQIVESQGEMLVEAATAMARAFGEAKKLLSFGNGGSATDAQDVADDFALPPVPGRPPLPALSLTQDVAVVTAVGNDVGFDNVFARQIIALGEPGDIAFGISTSGNSPSVLVAFERAKAMDLLTIGLAGYDGGKMKQAGTVDYCFVAPSTYIPRIQEGQATIYHALWELTHTIFEGNGAGR